MDYILNLLCAFLPIVEIFLLCYSNSQFPNGCKFPVCSPSAPTNLFSSPILNPLFWGNTHSQTREKFVMFTSCCLITSTSTSCHDQMAFISSECDNVPPTWGKPVSAGQPGYQLIEYALWVTDLPLFKINLSINLSILFLKQFLSSLF